MMKMNKKFIAYEIPKKKVEKRKVSISPW